MGINVLKSCIHAQVYLLRRNIFYFILKMTNTPTNKALQLTVIVSKEFVAERLSSVDNADAESWQPQI